MHPLYQRLKELDWDTFQRLCFQLVAERHPGLGIKHVEGAGGDRGLDLFLGQLAGGPVIWQCKQFSGGLGARQRPQVLKSLREAVKHFKPKTWVLVTSVDLGEKAHQWFQKIQQNYAHVTSVGLFQASDIVRELIHRKRLREAFFPGAVFDSLAVKRALVDLGQEPLTQLEADARGKLEEMIARLEGADARFNYRIAYGPDLGAEIMQEAPSHPLMVASFVDAEKRIDVFARDLAALTLDPPTVEFAFNPSGVAKVDRFIRTGMRQELGAGEFTLGRSSFDFMLPKAGLASWNMVLTQSHLLTNRRLRVRMTFANSDAKVVYDYVEFTLARAGTDEFEIVSISKLPFVMGLTIRPRERSCSFSISEHIKGSEVTAAAKFLTAFGLLRSQGRVEIFDLENSKEAGALEVTSARLPESHENLQRILSAAARVAERFGVALNVPEKITKAELDVLALLDSIIDGSSESSRSFSAKVVKDRSKEQTVEEWTLRPLDLLITWPRIDPPPVLFGRGIDTGPVTLTASNARVDDPTGFLSVYRAASDGEAVPIVWNADDLRVRLGAAGPPGRLLVKAPG